MEAYEEVKFEPSVMVDRLTPTMTLAAAQLEDGDILVFQRAVPQVGRLMWCCISSSPVRRASLGFCRVQQGP